MKIYTKGKIKECIEATLIVNRGTYYDIYMEDKHIEQLIQEEIVFITG